ncbi:hypothetical protein Dimus_010149, partial [Dionaea muscipula]
RLGMLVICRRSSEPRIPQVRSEKRVVTIAFTFQNAEAEQSHSLFCWVFIIYNINVAQLEVAINGFERIGRNFLRWHGRKNSPLDVVVVNDSGGVKNVALDIDYHHNMLISHQKVNPKEAIIGWMQDKLGGIVIASATCDPKNPS